MEIVLDSNVLFRILITSGDIKYIAFNSKLHIFAPLKLKEEFNKHHNEILVKSKQHSKEFNEQIELLFKQITFIARPKYETYLPKAKKLLKGHNKDEDFLALALFKNCKLWTYESRFFELDYAISTKQISKLL